MRVFRYIVGLLLLTFSISLIVLSGIGASPWDAANAGLGERFVFSFGTWTTITGILLVFLISFITKEKPVYTSIIVGVVTGILIDFWTQILQMVNISEGFLIGIIGIILFALGINLYTKTNLPVNPIDNFMVNLMKYKNMSFAKAKLITDIIGLTIALIVGGPIGLGTIIIYLLVPVMLQIFDKFI